jgi:hypothetical protein
VTGSIDPVGDTDPFAFDARSPGVISITTSPLVCPRLSDPAGNPLEIKDHLAAVTKGLHRIEIFECFIIWNNEIVPSYTLSVQGASANLTCGEPLNCGENWVDGAIESKGDTDAFVFDVEAPGVVSITTSPFVCPRLFDLNGTPVEIGGRLATVAKGPHTIEIFECSGSPNDEAVPSYSLSIRAVSASLTCKEPISCGEGRATRAAGAASRAARAEHVGISPRSKNRISAP